MAKAGDALIRIRGALLAENPHRKIEVVMGDDRSMYAVPSATDSNVTYTVFIDEDGQWVCIPCPSFKDRQKPCKHIYEVLYRFFPSAAAKPPESELEQVRNAGQAYQTARRFPIQHYQYEDGLAESTRKDHALMTQAPRFEELLLDLGEAVDRQFAIPTGRGRRELTPGERVIALVLKYYQRKSIRVFNPEITRLASEGKLSFSVRKSTIIKYSSRGETLTALETAFNIAIQPFCQETKFIVDSTGLSNRFVSNWINKKYKQEDIRPDTQWLKWHALIGWESKAILAYRLTPGEGSNTGDASNLEPLMKFIAESGFDNREYVIADNIYLFPKFFKQAQSYDLKLIGPLKGRNFTKAGVPRGYIQEVADFRERYPEEHDYLCRKRSIVESLFSVDKRKSNRFAAIGTEAERKTALENPLFMSRRIEMACRVIRQVLEKTVEQELLRNRTVSYRNKTIFSHVREYSPMENGHDNA
jgi:hypothetical protein